MTRVMFFHGMEGSPTGDKPTALAKVFPSLQVPNFANMGYYSRWVLSERLLLHGSGPAYLIGSSMGGRLAVALAHRHPDLVAGYLLLAPALRPMDLPTDGYCVPKVGHILVGEQDEIAGLKDAAVAFGARHGFPTTVVQDGHRLVNHIPLIVQLAQEGYAAAHLGGSMAT